MLGRADRPRTPPVITAKLELVSLTPQRAPGRQRSGTRMWRNARPLRAFAATRRTTSIVVENWGLAGDAAAAAVAKWPPHGRTLQVSTSSAVGLERDPLCAESGPPFLSSIPMRAGTPARRAHERFARQKGPSLASPRPRIRQSRTASASCMDWARSGRQPTPAAARKHNRHRSRRLPSYSPIPAPSAE
jgi:hypothetical protein